MKKLLYVVGVLLMLCGAAFAGRWPADYPKFHDKAVCPDTAFTGRISCEGTGVADVLVTLDNFNLNEKYVSVTDDNGYFYAIVPIGFYRVSVPSGASAMINAKWKCGVLPFYFEYCP